MPSSSSEYKIPDFILREAMSSGGANADLVDKNGKVMFQANADGWLTAAPAGGTTSEDWSIYQELTAIAEEIQRCRAQVL